MGSKNTSPIGGYYPTAQSTNSTTQGSGISAQVPDPLASLAYIQTLQNAAQIANTPYQPYQGQQVAGFTPDQIAAMQGYRDIQGITQPYINQASAMTNQAAGLADPNQYNFGSLQRYMNPYQQSVIDATLAQMKQNQDEMFVKNNAESVRRGSYGGSGQALGRAEQMRQLGLSNAQTLAGLNSANYQQAMGQYNQQQQQAIDTLLRGGAQQAGLGNQSLAARGSELGALYQSGAQQQALGQQQLNKAFEQWQQAKAYPYQQTSYFGSLAQGLGPLLGQYGTTSTTSNTQGAQQGWQPYQNQSGGGGLAGLLTTGLGLATKAFSGGLLAKGGVVKDRTHKADGGYMEHMKDAPYGEGPIDLAAGFGSLMNKQPYAGGDDYISRAEKTSQVLKPANKLAAENLSREINKMLNVKSEPDFKEQESGIKSKFFGAQDGDSGEDYGKALGAGADFLKAAANKSNISLGDIGSAFEGALPSFKKGGRVGFADGGTFAEQAQRAQQAKDQAQEVLSDYKNILGRTAEQGGFDFWTQQRAAGRTPEAVRTDFYNSPEYQQTGGIQQSQAVNQDATKIGGYDQLLKRAMANNPGPQLTPEQQGMPSMPSQAYYSGQRPSYPGVIGGNLNIAGSMGLPDKFVDPGVAPATEAETALANARNAYNASVSDAQSRQQIMALGLAQSGINPAIAVQMAVSANPTPAAPASLGDLEEAVKNQPPRETPANPYTNFLNSVYQNYMGRNPTQDEINVHINDMKGGKTPSAVEATVQSSREGQNTAFLNQMYSDAFGRAPDLGGLNFWKDQLSKGMPASQIASRFESSPEYQSIPDIFRSNAPVQGYFSSLQDTQFNPYTGLFNIKYDAPYRGTPQSYGLAPGLNLSNDLSSDVLKQVTNRIGSKDGGAVEKASGGSRGSKLSMQEIARAALQAGATPREAAILTAIAMPESSGVYNIHNFNRGTGDESYGLWQINMLGKMGPERMRQFGLSSKSDLYDPVTNAKAALQLLRGRGGLKNWTTYTSGKFKPYYSAALDAVRGIAGNSEALNMPLPKFTGETIGTESVGPTRAAAASPNERARGFVASLLNVLNPVSSAYANEVNYLHEPGKSLGPELPASHANMGPEFPASHPNVGPQMSEMGAPLPPRRPSDLNVVATDETAQPKAGQKYWGDYRDVENNPFGDFIDTLAGDVRASDKPGTAKTPMGKFAGQGGLGALFDLEGTGGAPPEQPKRKKEEEASDFGGLFDFFS